MNHGKSWTTYASRANFMSFRNYQTLIHPGALEQSLVQPWWRYEPCHDAAHAAHTPVFLSSHCVLVMVYTLPLRSFFLQIVYWLRYTLWCFAAHTPVFLSSHCASVMLACYTPWCDFAHTQLFSFLSTIQYRYPHTLAQNRMHFSFSILWASYIYDSFCLQCVLI